MTGDKVFLLSKEEFMILAAAFGIRRMYGFSMESVRPDDQTVIQCMQNLMKREMLLSVDGKFQVLEPLASYFEQIRDEKTTVDVHKRSGRNCIVYINDFGVKVSISQRRPEMLEIQRIETGEIWKYLTDEGWIPERKE